jgi:hypothetical protein
MKKGCNMKTLEEIGIGDTPIDVKTTSREYFEPKRSSIPQHHLVK